jgi:holliday junction DNA helicase ruvA
MIATVRGTVVALGPASAVVEASGVGYAVQATPSTLAGLREGVEVLLHTSLVVREDSMTLFGFADRDEREVFEVLQSVSGVGPRLALAMLATLAPDALRRAVACGDVAALQRVPGIGKKGAQRLVLELGAKLGPERSGRADPGESATVSGDVVEALVGLGWSERDAAAAVAEAGGDSPEAGLPELLRASLRVLGARR